MAVIQKPTDKENAVQAVVDINGHGISTSGRNYYELDGKRLSHVIDPQTGRPIEHNLVSVTVIAPTALEADAWDTGLFDGTRAGESQRGCSPGRAGSLYDHPKKAIALKPGCHHGLSFLVSEKIKAQDCWFA